MAHSTRALGRNDRCPCGSGRKVKQCCGASTRARGWAATAVAIAVGAAMLGALLIGVMALTGERASSPPGRMWSAEHGHWHDAGGNHIKAQE